MALVSQASLDFAGGRAKGCRSRLGLEVQVISGLGVDEMFLSQLMSRLGFLHN